MAEAPLYLSRLFEKLTLFGSARALNLKATQTKKDSQSYVLVRRGRLIVVVAPSFATKASMRLVYSHRRLAPQAFGLIGQAWQTGCKNPFFEGKG